MYFKDGAFHPICGHHFWDNNEGAKLFCQKLGYTEGQIDTLGKSQSYNQDSIWIGLCQSVDGDISTCSGPCNTKQVGGDCVDSYDDCNAGALAKMSIKCNGGASLKTRSCSISFPGMSFIGRILVSIS